MTSSDKIKELYKDYGVKLPFLVVLIIVLVPFRLTAEAMVFLLTQFLKGIQWFLKITEI